MELLDVTSVQHGCVYDGEGVRTTVFLRGCPFRCPWCCNPETLQSRKALFIDDEKCFYRKGVFSPLCDDCERKDGQRSIERCPFGVAEATCKEYSLEELYKEIISDSSLYEQSHGGVTFSGGDPLLQSAQLLPLLQRLRNANINIAYETTLYYTNNDLFRNVAEYVDPWIVDLKLQPVNFKKDYENVVSCNLKYLREQGKTISYRLVFVADVEALSAISAMQRLYINNIEVIKCHALAKTKYQKLGLAFEDYTPTDEAYDDFIHQLSEAGLDVTKLTI